MFFDSQKIPIWTHTWSIFSVDVFLDDLVMLIAYLEEWIYVKLRFLSSIKSNSMILTITKSMLGHMMVN